MGFRSFVELFVVKALHYNIGMIFSLPMLEDLQVAFLMFSLCYAQRLGYLHQTMFPFLVILQHLIKFDIRIIATLEKLLGVGSFGGSIAHLTHRQTIIPTSLNKFNILFIV
jgi:hypothetical protein